MWDILQDPTDSVMPQDYGMKKKKVSVDSSRFKKTYQPSAETDLDGF